MIKKAMIMAAGVGSRLDPLTQSRPKPLIPIVNQPVMDLLLNHLKSFGIEEVVANTYYKAEDIHKRYGDKSPIDIKCKFVYEKELSGTAGGVKKCEWFFEPKETFVVLSADGLTDFDLKKIIESHKKSGAIVTMGLTEVPHEEVQHFGVVVTNKNSEVIEFQEKPSLEEAKSNLVNTGIYVFETKVFDYIPEDTFYDFAKNVFPQLMANNKKINSFVIKNYWSDIGTMNQYRTSTKDILQGKTNVDLGYPENENGWFAPTAKVDQLGIKNGKMIVGEASIIEGDTTFEGYNVVGDNCLVRKGAKLTNCILWDNVVIENNVELEDCIIASNTIIDKNLKLQKGSVIKSGSAISVNSEIAELISVN